MHRIEEFIEERKPYEEKVEKKGLSKMSKNNHKKAAKARTDKRVSKKQNAEETGIQLQSKPYAPDNYKAPCPLTKGASKEGESKSFQRSTSAQLPSSSPARTNKKEAAPKVQQNKSFVPTQPSEPRAYVQTVPADENEELSESQQQHLIDRVFHH